MVNIHAARSESNEFRLINQDFDLRPEVNPRAHNIIVPPRVRIVFASIGLGV